MGNIPVIVNSNSMHEATIGDHVYEFAKWPAGEAVDTLLEFTSLIGKPLSAIMAKGFANGESLQSNIDADTLANVFEQLFGALNPENRPRVLAIIKQLATRNVICDGKPGPLVFDVHYKDEYAHLWDVARTAFEIQYGNFFAAIGGKLGLRSAIPQITKAA